MPQDQHKLSAGPGTKWDSPRERSKEPVVYQGQIARDKKGQLVTITKYSDRMLEVLAKAKCPEFRDKHEITGADDGPVTFQVRWMTPEEEKTRVVDVVTGVPPSEEMRQSQPSATESAALRATQEKYSLWRN